MSNPEWKEALEYYKKRGAVLFISYCRFWERHGFVQQCLARRLALEGVRVVWLDGSDWRRYRPVVLDPIAELKVGQMPQLPLRRFSFVSELDRKAKSAYLKKVIRQLGGNPVIWVQAGIDEGVAADLPYVDVFSVFDDPYRHSPVGTLCHKAKVIVCQNQTARSSLKALHASKTQVLPPPVDMTDGSMEGSAEVYLPEGFPKRVMGYVGSFFSDGFDLDLFGDFIQSYPDWGFVLMGRTDPKGLAAIRQWKGKRNFHYFPWVPRKQVAAVWKKIDLTLLFYRPNPTQDGAFPTKIVEGLRFGVPCIATDVPKTADLEGIFPRGRHREELKQQVESALAISEDRLGALYEQFASEMDPKRHLTKVAQWVQRQK